MVTLEMGDLVKILEKAVEEGRKRPAQAVDAYKATESRLFALPVLRQKVEDDRRALEELKAHGLTQRSKSLVRFSRSGQRLSREEILEAVVMDKEAVIASDEYEIECVERALAPFQTDPFYYALEAKYFLDYEDEDAAQELHCGKTQLWRQRKRLVHGVAVMLYGAMAAG